MTKSIKRKIFYGLIIAVIAVIFFLLSSLLVINIHLANHQVLLEKHKSITDLLLQRQKNGIIVSTDVSYIDYWMTFKYINLTFKLPDNYLKDKFSITDKNYQNIPLGRYASAHKINRAIFVNDIKQAVSIYLETNSKKQ